jgi:hypothetical protein
MPPGLRPFISDAPAKNGFSGPTSKGALAVELVRGAGRAGEAIPAGPAGEICAFLWARGVYVENPPMTWILIAYLAALLYVSANQQKFANPAALRPAWLWFAAVPISHFFFTLIRAGNFGDPRDLALVEIWSEGFQWLLLGVSIVYLAGAVAPRRGGDWTASPPPPPAS